MGTCVAVLEKMAKEGLTLTPFEKSFRKKKRKKKPCTYQMTEHTRQKALRVKMLRLEHACSDE